MKPWISGPKELLKHAVEHMNSGSSFDNRIALISVDNAVEIMVKTFLGLPKRINKLEPPSKKKIEDASHSFPDLLDLLEKYGSKFLGKVDLADIEWYHGLRNRLYHEGNGVTVDKEQVDSYLQISIVLFNNLFDEYFIKEREFEPKTILGEIILRFSQLEEKVKQLYIENFPTEDFKSIPLSEAFHRLNKRGVISDDLLDQFELAFMIRNKSIHNAGVFDKVAVVEATDTVIDIIKKISALHY